MCGLAHYGPKITVEGGIRMIRTTIAACPSSRT